MNKEEKIDRYLLNRMERKEIASFENEMAEDPQLGREVNIVQDIMRGLEIYSEEQLAMTIESVKGRLDQEGFFADEEEKELIEGIREFGHDNMRKTISDVSSDLKDEGFFLEKDSKLVQMDLTRTSRNWYRIAGLAASVLIVGFCLWLLLKPEVLNPIELYAEEFSPMSDQLSPLITGDLEETGFTPSDQGLLMEMQVLMQYYEEENYEDFINTYSQLRTWLEGHPYQPHLQFYLSQCYMELSRFDEAIDVLSELKVMETYDHPDQINWYLALAYLGKGDEDASLEYLEGISGQSEYHRRAQLLIGRL